MPSTQQQTNACMENVEALLSKNTKEKLKKDSLFSRTVQNNESVFGRGALTSAADKQLRCMTMKR